MIESHSFLEFRQNRGGTEAAYFPKLQPNISRMIHFQFSKEGDVPSHSSLGLLCVTCEIPTWWLIIPSREVPTWWLIIPSREVPTWWLIIPSREVPTLWLIIPFREDPTWWLIIPSREVLTWWLYYSISWDTYLVTILFHLVRYLLGDCIIPSREIPTWWLYYSILWGTYLVTVLFHLVKESPTSTSKLCSLFSTRREPRQLGHLEQFL